MLFQDLLTFIKKEDLRLSDRSNNIDPEKRVLARMVKISEEVGELSDVVLSSLSLQRQRKLDKYDAADLPNELADVVLTTMLLAETMGVDIEEALEKKMQKIDKRYEIINDNLLSICQKNN